MTTGVLSRTFYTHFGINVMQMALLCCLQPKHHHRPTREQGPVIEMPHFFPSFLLSPGCSLHRRRGGPLRRILYALLPREGLYRCLSRHL
jgi:hypothetical protein